MSDFELEPINSGQSHHNLDRNNILSETQNEIDLTKCPRYFEVYFNPKSWSEDVHLLSAPGRKYEQAREFRHKDYLGRVWIGTEDDRYLSATDGRLAPLVIQTAEYVSYGPSNSTWARKRVEECTPYILQVVSSLLGNQLQNKNPSIASLVPMCLSWIPSCLIIAALLFIPADLGGEKRKNGRYEQFKYHYWGYAKVAANRHEIPPSRNTNRSAPYQNTHGISQRNLRPRRLCLLRDDEGIDIVDVNEWEAHNGTLDYLFICFTTLQFSYDSIEDMEELHRISESAARQAGVDAYWVACSCMPDDEECSEDVYRISDIVRGAHSLVVIIGPTPDSSASIKEMLRQLGSRMWTFPEVLLSPANKTISVYLRDCDTDHFRVFSKRNFILEAWDDALISRQLIDHYESSILLSPL